MRHQVLLVVVFDIEFGGLVIEVDAESLIGDTRSLGKKNLLPARPDAALRVDQLIVRIQK